MSASPVVHVEIDDAIATITLDSQHNRNASVASVARRTAPGTRHRRGSGGPGHRAHPPGPGVLRRRRPEGTIVAGDDRNSTRIGLGLEPVRRGARAADGHRASDDRRRERGRARRRDRAHGGLRPRGGRSSRRRSRSPRCASAWRRRSSRCRSCAGSHRAGSPRRCSPASRSMLTKPARWDWSPTSAPTSRQPSSALTAGILAGRPGRSPRRSGCSTPSARWIAQRHSRTMARLSNELFESAEAAEGMAAFVAKRPPVWRTTP